MPLQFIDMNNDGVDDKVLKLSARTHAHDGEAFFLYDTKLPDEKGRTLDYAKSATHIFPYHWFGETVKFTDKYVDFPNSSHKLLNAKAPWWSKEDSPVFDLRYSYWKPLRYKGTTYFYVSKFENLGNWRAVIRPEKNHTLTEICIFYTADVHY